MARLIVPFALLYLFSDVRCARILAVYPTPSISHHLSFRQLTLALLNRGHEVVVVTTHPAFKNGETPKNLTEIDVGDVSYDLWMQKFKTTGTGKVGDLEMQMRAGYEVMLEIFVKQLQKPAVRELLYDSTFDLLILETWVRSTLVFSHFHKIPVIRISSMGAFFGNFEDFGAPNYQLVYPLATRQRLIDLSMWERISELYVYYSIFYGYKQFEKIETEVLRRDFAPDMPNLSELCNNVDLLFLNYYSIWDHNRPVPPSVVYIGGMHKIEPQKLPEDLEKYLNSSKNGVIYMSFGTNMNPSSLPPCKIRTMMRAFSKLPYDVLWKWDKDQLPGKTKNIRIAKWFPQTDLLKHPKIKLFITQAGLQSTYEALTAGVPVLGIPILGDQWYNAEKYVQFKIGHQLNIETITEAEFKRTILELIQNSSYRENIVKLHSLLLDQPQSALDKAVWWIEHLLRHGGGKHLRAAGAGMSWTEYINMDLIIIFFVIFSLLFTFVIGSIFYLIDYLATSEPEKLKRN